MTFDEAEKWISDPRGTGPELSRLYSMVNLAIRPSGIDSMPFTLIQNPLLDKTFLAIGTAKVDVYKKYGLFDCIGTEDNLVDYILNGRTFYWLATREKVLQDGPIDEIFQDGLVDKIDGTMCVPNPFCRCKNLAEALIKADLLGDVVLSDFKFVLTPMWIPMRKTS